MNDGPKVYNVRHRRSMPADAVFVGRPSRFGNPFKIGVDGTREEVVTKYREWVMADMAPYTKEDIRRELRGKNLSCFCAPEPCHADVLLEISNSED